MRNWYSRSVMTIACLLGLSVILVGTATAGVPQLINYQGRLTNVSGDPLDTTVSMIFTIYDDSTGGNPQWSETKPAVEVKNGLFDVILGENLPVGESIFSSPDRYLGIAVGGDPEIAPRTRLVSAPFSHHALKSDTSAYAYAIADDSVTSARIATDAVIAEKIAAGAVTADKIGDDAVNSARIEDASILFVDIAPNDASEGQVMKWNGSGWVAAGDDTGIPSGWINDGAVIRLENAGDSVGIGTSSPGAKLDVAGNIIISGTITSGQSITIDGADDMITASSGTISFDDENIVTEGKVSIGPGHSNSGANAFVAGEDNTVSGSGSSITGGKWNVVDGDYSTIPGGFADTIASTADYSCLFGIGSKLTQDSTFMVDMPHIRFGNETTGYEMPNSDGSNGQVMVTDGAGLLSWSNIPGAVWSDQGTWVKLLDITDNVSIGGSSYPSEKLYIAGDVRITGKANIGLNTTNAGIHAFVAGESNTASGNYSTVGGGRDNTASGTRSVVGGGHDNAAGGSQSTTSGGAYNAAIGGYSCIPGGRDNSAIGDYSLAAGKNSKANHPGAVVISANFSLSSGDSVRSGGMDQMVLRADGGLYVTNSQGLAPFDVTKLINTVTGAYLSAAGVWTNATKFSEGSVRDVDGKAILEQIAQLAIKRWTYENDDYNVDHIGPSAEDFHSLFDVGTEDGLSMVDPAGIALAAIQELYKKTREIDELRAQVSELQRIILEIQAGR